MHQACEVLAIEAVEPGVEVAQAQRLAHRIIGTDVGEITGRVAAVAIQVQAGAVRGVAQLELVQVTGGEAQPIDVGAVRPALLNSSAARPSSCTGNRPLPLRPRPESNRTPTRARASSPTPKVPWVKPDW
ncbi:hypothetical protein WR25_16007 [Diploscapter pachys]|uniref:Uncharacterized protein n=1 Tax=Diploscapter pachys TaxID=2018661 RepID=A0A2A2K6F2_9BILA|nr:hypothetical protein WR25_16007 [Diploscapter pachys]